MAIYVDVDDTFIRSAGTKRIPIPAIIAHIRSFHEQGATLYCWSAGGADYARQSAEESRIAHCFTAFLPKPNLLLDDQNPADWPRCTLIHPATCTSELLAKHIDNFK
jgi:hypothetical protein